MKPEEKLRNIIFRIIDANSLTGANLEETRQIFEAIQQVKSEWCKKAIKWICENYNTERIDFEDENKINDLLFEFLNAPEP